MSGAEGCDDGNATPADGCTACVVDGGFECGGAPSACALAASFVRFPSEVAPLQAALDAAANGVLFVEPGTHLTTVAEATSSVVIVGAPGAVLDSDGLTQIASAVTVNLRSLEMRATRGGSGVWSVSNGGTLDIEGCVIGPSTGTGILVNSVGDPSTLRVRRSRVIGNPTGGIRNFEGDAPYEIVNNFISGNGSSNSQAGGVILQSSNGTFAHNSVANNIAGNQNPAGVRCNTAAVLQSSIVFGNGGQGNTSAACISTGSLVGVDPLFVDAAAGDLHLQAGSPAIDAASGSTLAVDIDGDPRTGLRDIGADER